MGRRGDEPQALERPSPSGAFSWPSIEPEAMDKATSKFSSPDNGGRLFILLFLFQFSFCLWIKLSLFLLFPFAFVSFSLVTHIRFSLPEND